MKTRLLKKIRKKFHIKYGKEVINTVSIKKVIKPKDFYNVNDLFEVSKIDIVNTWKVKSKKGGITYSNESLKKCITWAIANL